MDGPAILSGVVCVAMLALGFNLLLPLGSGLDAVNRTEFVGGFNS
jgi:hypothetical protein